MKIGAQILAYNQEFFLEYALRSVYDACDVIHITASDLPWKYTGKAEQYKKGDSTFDILDNFPDPDGKFIIEKGYWPSEHDQRTHSTNVLRENGCDYLFVVDADEIYADDALVGIREKLVADTCQVTQRLFWRHFGWRLMPDARANTFYKIHPDTYFDRGRRIPVQRKKVLIDLVCHHFSYVRTPERMKEKIDTWMHAPQMRNQSWYEDVWLNWTPDIKNLHPFNPTEWPEAVPYPIEELPSVLKTHPWYGKID